MSNSHRFELYVVFTEPVSEHLAADSLKSFGLVAEFFLHDSGLVRAARIEGTPQLSSSELLALCLVGLNNVWRWLEFGWRLQGQFDGRLEPIPWRKNRYLSLADLKSLIQPEFGLHYHAPEPG